MHIETRVFESEEEAESYASSRNLTDYVVENWEPGEFVLAYVTGGEANADARSIQD